MSFGYKGSLEFSIFGQSHSEAIGTVISGLPCGFEIDLSALQAFVNRRRAAGAISTARKEADVVKIISGLFDGKTCGSPIAAVIYNGDTRSADYDKIINTPRPSHADYTASVKYGGFNDYRGGGHFSGRLTAPLCVVGGIARQILAARGITVGAHLYKIKNVCDRPYDPVNLTVNDLAEKSFPVLEEAAGEAMKEVILSAKKGGDSVGGVIEVGVIGLPAGLGEPNFDGVENVISRLAFAVPAVKGIEFGNGFAAAELFGSENNDVLALTEGKIVTVTNNAGGVNGGITNGMPLVFRVALKPTPSIQKPQKTLNIATGEREELTVGGRHDPCVAVRAVPVMESVAAIACLDMLIASKKDELNIRK